MRVAVSCQGDLARADDLLVAQAVAVQDLALDQPGLQADVRCARDVIEKTPCPHHPLLAIGEGAADNHAFAEVGAGERMRTIASTVGVLDAGLAERGRKF